jgi:hypothetical protein
MGLEPQVSTGRSRFYAFFSNPWVGIAGTAASIIGVPLAVYFYLQSVSYPDLVYLVNPVRTVVVKQGTASRLGVTFDGRPLTQDVTASQVAIWNRGRQAIRRAAILQAVTIATEPKAAILEATIRKTTRDVVGFDLDRTRLADGEVSVAWNILEDGDGGVVQLVYASGVDTQIRCRGVIEGQRAVRELSLPWHTIESPESQLRSLRWLRYIFVALALPMLYMFVWTLINWQTEIGSLHGRARLVELVVSVAVPVVGLGLILYWLLARGVPTPPFGFQ